MERATYVTPSGRFRVEKRSFGRGKNPELLYVVVDTVTGDVWPGDMPGVDELWEAKSWADRQEQAHVP